jgi:hypothetical protein
MSLNPNSTVLGSPVEATKIPKVFELPHELRDLIYDQPEMLEDITLETTSR